MQTLHESSDQMLPHQGGPPGQSTPRWGQVSVQDSSGIRSDVDGHATTKPYQVDPRTRPATAPHRRLGRSGMPLDRSTGSVRLTVLLLDQGRTTPLKPGVGRGASASPFHIARQKKRTINRDPLGGLYFNMETPWAQWDLESIVLLPVIFVGRSPYFKTRPYGYCKDSALH